MSKHHHRSNLQEKSKQNNEKFNQLINEIQNSDTLKALILIMEMDDKKLSDVDERGWTLLHHCASYGNARICKTLLEHSSNENANKEILYKVTHNTKSTALHIAVWHNQIDVCKLLLENMDFKNIFAKNFEGQTALDLADQQKLPDIIRIINVSTTLKSAKHLESAKCLFTSGDKEGAIRLYEEMLSINHQYRDKIWQEIERLKLEADLKNLSELPRFVINTIAYVPDREGTMSGDSSDEDYENDRDFLQWEKRNKKHGLESNFLFKTYKNETKKVQGYETLVRSQELGRFKGEEIDLKKNKKPQKDNTPTVSDIVAPFLNKLSYRGFEEYDRDKLEYLVSVSIGLNRPKSLSTRKNKVLEDELGAESNSEVSHEKFGFYWEYNWYDNGERPVDYHRVRKFYKQLKKYDKDHNTQTAEIFREQNEEESGIAVPYQALREHVARHSKTQLLVQEFRDKHPQAHTYFSFIDADTVDFNGIYSAYLRIYKEQSLQYGRVPTVMSTGYEFRGQGEDYPYEIGSKLDRAIRVETARHIPLGVYYPEPNFCVLLPQDRKTLPESFVEKNGRLKNAGNTESAVLLRQIFKSCPNDIYIFSDDNPLITEIPVRTRLNLKTKQQGQKGFSQEFKKGSVPTPEDLRALKFNQSHFDEQNWANNLYINRTFEFNKGYKPLNDKGRILTTWNEFFVGPAKKFLDHEFSEDNLKNLFNKVGPSIFIKIVAAAEGVYKIREKFKSTGIIEFKKYPSIYREDEILNILNIAVKLELQQIINLVHEKYGKYISSRQKLKYFAEGPQNTDISNKLANLLLTDNKWWDDAKILDILGQYARDVERTCISNLEQLRDYLNHHVANSDNKNHFIILNVNSITKSFEGNNHWVGLYIKPDREFFHLTYVDPMGHEINAELEEFLIERLKIQTVNQPLSDRAIQYSKLEGENEFIRYTEDGNTDDCGPMTVYLLLALSHNNNELLNLIRPLSSGESKKLGIKLRKLFEDKNLNLENIFNETKEIFSNALGQNLVSKKELIQKATEFEKKVEVLQEEAAKASEDLKNALDKKQKLAEEIERLKKDLQEKLTQEQNMHDAREHMLQAIQLLGILPAQQDNRQTDPLEISIQAHVPVEAAGASNELEDASSNFS